MSRSHQSGQQGLAQCLAAEICCNHHQRCPVNRPRYGDAQGWEVGSGLGHRGSHRGLVSLTYDAQNAQPQPPSTTPLGLVFALSGCETSIFSGRIGRSDVVRNHRGILHPSGEPRAPNTSLFGAVSRHNGILGINQG